MGIWIFLSPAPFKFYSFILLLFLTALPGPWVSKFLPEQHSWFSEGIHLGVDLPGPVVVLCLAFEEPLNCLFHAYDLQSVLITSYTQYSKLGPGFKRFFSETLIRAVRLKPSQICSEERFHSGL